MDELTTNGILTDDAAVTLLDYVDLHGQPVHIGADCVVFRDEHGHELNDWADALGVSRGELSERMHTLAREVYQPDEPGDPWGAADPVVFDAGTFQRDGFEAIAMLLHRGCSPAEAIDLFATEDQAWSQAEWAEWRGVSQQNVSSNVSGGNKELDG